MFKRFGTNYMATLFFLDCIIIQLSLWIALQLRYYLPIGQTVQSEWARIFFYVPSIGLHIGIGALWLVSFISLSIYTPRYIIRWYDETQRIILAHAIAALSLAGLLYLARIELLRLVYVYFFVITLFIMLGYRLGLRTWHRLRRMEIGSIANVLIAGAGQAGRDLVTEFERQGWPGINLVGFLDDDAVKVGSSVMGLPILGRIQDAESLIKRHGVEELIIALPSTAHGRLVNLVTELSEIPVRIRVVPDYFELAYFGATVENLGRIPLIGLRDPALDGFQRFVKRIVDIIVSSLAILGLSPVMILVAIAVKLEDGGPILYDALRVGENGRLFRMRKFRSMVVGADRIQIQTKSVSGSDAVHKQPNDARVTRVGSFIRRTSLDELPQLFNVLKDEMSLVGPRPEIPHLVKHYEPWQRKRFAVPQGMTGWWQVNGRSDNAMHLHTDQDLYYIRNYSLWLDIQILWRTITVVVRGRGAY